MEMLANAGKTNKNLLIHNLNPKYFIQNQSNFYNGVLESYFNLFFSCSKLFAISYQGNKVERGFGLLS